MATSIAKSSFATGELAPALWGRTDLNKWQTALSCARNGFTNYRGGIYSRPGMAFVGQCKQSGSADPPWLIPFRFSIFQNYILEFGDNYMRVVADGAYVTETAFNITGSTQADPCVLTIPGNNFVAGDWIYLSGIGGMFELNTQIVVVTNALGPLITIGDTFGHPINALAFDAYTSGGTAARIFTLTTPYAAADLPYLKWTQSADVMSLCLVNQQTQKEYATNDLTRLAANSWTLAPPQIASSIGPPNPPSAVATPWQTGQTIGNISGFNLGTTSTTGIIAVGDTIYSSNVVPGTIINGGSGAAWTINISQTVAAEVMYFGTGTPTAYGYVVTAIDAVTGDESIASNIAVALQGADISLTYGTVTLSWTPPPDAPNGVSGYNIYKCTPDFTNTGEFVGQLFGYAGSTNGATTWTDDNIIPDFTTVPPQNLDPFSDGQILSVGTPPSNSGFSVTTTSTFINTATGSGGIIAPIISGGSIVAGMVVSAGEDYANGDTVAFFNTVEAITVPLDVGPSSGNAPGVVFYFQQRRGYAASVNYPDTYNFSQPGSYTNFDAGVPAIDSDAIVGDPWAEQVNGIQCGVPMPGGLIVGTGLNAWQLSGTGGAGTPITPAQQSAQPQDSYGFSATILPIRIGWHLLYVPQVGTIVMDMEYNYWNNMYAGAEISILSAHLFENYQIEQWALARQPWKIIWMVRNDGKLLSLTYLKEQEIAGFTRHDTNGLVQSCAVASEPPVDAPYFVVKRYIVGEMQWAYFLERMDNRLWTNDPESTYCVDAGASLPMTTPNATLTASAATPSLGVLAGPVIVGGQDYTAPVGVVVDMAGTGSGAVVSSVTVVAGAITAYTISPEGEGYQNPVVNFTDATGSGASVECFVDESVTFNASAAVFDGVNVGVVGQVIRMGGGKAQVTTFVSPTEVMANFIAPITETVPDDPNSLPIPAVSGTWSIATPVTVVAALDYLEGMTVTGLADGNVIPPTVVENGSITLPTAASAVTIGLPFIVQYQSMHIDIPGIETVQGKAVKVVGVTARVEGSRDFAMGQDQPIASAEPNQAEYPWTNMATVQSNKPPAPLQTAPPLFTGDRYTSISGDWNLFNRTPNDTVPMPGEAPRAPGMVALQQTNPLPLNLLSLFPAIVIGDTNDQSDLRG